MRSAYVLTATSPGLRKSPLQLPLPALILSLQWWNCFFTGSALPAPRETSGWFRQANRTTNLRNRFTLREEGDVSGYVISTAGRMGRRSRIDCFSISTSNPLLRLSCFPTLTFIPPLFHSIYFSVHYSFTTTCLSATWLGLLSLHPCSLLPHLSQPKVKVNHSCIRSST